MQCFDCVVTFQLELGYTRSLWCNPDSVFEKLPRILYQVRFAKSFKLKPCRANYARFDVANLEPALIPKASPVCDKVVCVTELCVKDLCVCTICIDVKLHFTAGGHRGPRGSVANEDTPWVPVKTYLLYNIYIYIFLYNIYIYNIYIYIPAPGRI